VNRRGILKSAFAAAAGAVGIAPFGAGEGTNETHPAVRGNGCRGGTRKGDAGDFP
jgi:hypothetical protein